MNRQTFTIPEGYKFITQELDLENRRIITTFEPEFKRGDIVESFGDIHIVSKIKNDSLFFDVILHGNRNYIDLYYNDWGKTKNFRHAIDSEKQRLFDALAKEGKQWNAEKCCIEDLKVVPKVGDCCRIDFIGGGSDYLVYGGTTNDGHKSKGNIFSTKGNKVYKSMYYTEDVIFMVLEDGKFQKELNDIGFEYNFKNDTIIELNWKPKDGEECFHIFIADGIFYVNRIWFNNENTEHLNLLFHGLIRKGIKECEEAITKIKNILK